jgi:hypothetical protein
MRIRFTGAIVALAGAAVVALAVMPIAGQAPQGGRAGGRGAERPRAGSTSSTSGTAARPARSSGAHCRSTEHERHLAGDGFRLLEPRGSLGIRHAVLAARRHRRDSGGPERRIRSGQRRHSVHPGGPEEARRAARRLPKSDPEAKCYMAGIPRSNYMPYPFQIVQGQKDILFVYEYASSNRIVHMSNHTEAPVDSWMGWSNGKWDGDTLAITVNGFNDQTWFDRSGNHHTESLTVEERFTLQGDNVLIYEATMTDPKTFTRPWKIRMPLYRRLEPNVQLLEFKCVEFSEELLYGDLKKK